jgi:hypothetical protein
MKKLVFLLFIMHSFNQQVSAQLSPFEKSIDRNKTAEYSEVIPFYQALDKKYSQLKMITCGLTDIGEPLHR